MSRVARRQPLNHSTSRTLAALLGSLPVALLVGIALAAALPVGLGQRYLLGSYAVLPLWLGLACCVFLAGSARRAWAALGIVSAIAGLVAWLALPLR
jgi:hypothetical protein